jgi:transposase
MIRPSFLDERSRKELSQLARNGSVAHRLARRANALVLLDRGLSCVEVAEVLLLDDDTIRSWHKLYEQAGIQSLAEFGYRGSVPRLDDAQQDRLRAWITQALPRTTREVGAWVEAEFGIVYDSRSGLVKLLHRLGMEHHRPQAIARKLDPAKQAAFIAAYTALLKDLQGDDVVLFGDAVHPLHEVRPMGCWAPAGTKLAVQQTSGRDRLNVHGAIDLETGRTCMLETASVDALSTIRLLIAISAAYPNKRLIHVFVDNARYHHAKMVTAWLAEPGCRIRLHFVPTYCPHLNPIERLWGQMHKHVTHNRCHAHFADFKAAVLTFLSVDATKTWRTLCDKVSDNFRIITPQDFRVMA